VKAAGLHHVSINVADVGAAREFYLSALGLEVRPDRPEFSFDGAWLNVGGQQVHLIHAEVPEQLGQHFALRVDDLDEAVSSLRALGYEVTDPVAVGRNRQSFLDDPSGNRVELQEVSSGQ